MRYLRTTKAYVAVYTPYILLIAGVCTSTIGLLLFGVDLDVAGIALTALGGAVLANLGRHIWKDRFLLGVGLNDTFVNKAKVLEENLYQPAQGTLLIKTDSSVVAERPQIKRMLLALCGAILVGLIGLIFSGVAGNNVPSSETSETSQTTQGQPIERPPMGIGIYTGSLPLGK